MKKLLTFLFFQVSLTCNAQNYQCLQMGVKHYFTNAEGYLRGIRLDSVNTSGSATIYYPFHTIRGNYFSYISLDSSGSWLGKKVIALSDGTFFFDNIWHDTVTIRTQANVGDSWIFYNDTTRRRYLATLIAHDTMTVLGILDSVKTIDIAAYDDSGFVPSDPVNNFKIILSKNHGFVQAIDLFTFPYHQPDTTYISRFDYYLDVLTGTAWSSSVAPVTAPITVSNSVFVLIPLINPPLSQIYDWNAGDVFENRVFNPYVTCDGTYPYQYYFDSITNKAVVGAGVQFNYTGWTATQQFGTPWATIYPWVNYPYALVNTDDSFVVTNNLVIDTTKMPEEANGPFLEYYFPYDTTHCIHSAAYHFIQPFVPFGEVSPLQITYKVGLGLVQYDMSATGAAPPFVNDTTLLYYVKSGVPCGTYVSPSPIFTEVANIQKKDFQFYPNPVSTVLTIDAPVLISNVTFVNPEGQTLYTQNCNSYSIQIDISVLPAGIYFAKINNAMAGQFAKE